MMNEMMNEREQSESGIFHLLVEWLTIYLWIIMIPILFVLLVLIKFVVYIYDTCLIILPYLGWGILGLIMLSGLSLMLASFYFYLKEHITLKL